MNFYVGLHQPHDAQHFTRSCISINRLNRRKSPFKVDRWIMDSGAFTEISTHGHYRADVAEYAAAARRWIGNGQLEAIVAQDWMCEPFILRKTGLTVDRHQSLTVERYDALLDLDPGAYVMPVLQGFQPEEYLRHIDLYGDRLAGGAWVGVGSVCKRNASPIDIATVLGLIGTVRPDLRLHGFGVKQTALLDPTVRTLLHSADSMAWSYHARMWGRDGNSWKEAASFRDKVEAASGLHSDGWQIPMTF